MPTIEGEFKNESFTLLKEDRERFLILKQQALSMGFDLNKSELVRLGLAALQLISKDEWIELINNLQRIKRGRRIEIITNGLPKSKKRTAT